MQTAEVFIPDDNLVDRLTDMRVWLDEHSYRPSSFTYFFLHPGMIIRVLFKIEDEAEAFAREFGGSLLDAPWVTDQLVPLAASRLNPTV